MNSKPPQADRFHSGIQTSRSCMFASWSIAENGIPWRVLNARARRRMSMLRTYNSVRIVEALFCFVDPALCTIEYLLASAYSPISVSARW